MRPISWKHLFRRSIAQFRNWLDAFSEPTTSRPGPLPEEGPLPKTPLKRLQRVILADDVVRTLFDEYALHRQTERGHEETGWVLLGYRGEEEATVVVTLPAGTRRDAGEAHVQFDWEVQLLASRIVRQEDRRLTMLGIVHTHPGSMRTPSGGDLRGDREWVVNLRGREGVFAIGTHTHEPETDTTSHTVAQQPAPNVLHYQQSAFNWYTLAEGDRRYQRVPVQVTIGPDLAAPLRSVWATIEESAGPLEKLAQQFRNVRFEIGTVAGHPTLSVRIGLGGGNTAIRVLLEGKSTRFYHEHEDRNAVPFDLPVTTRPDHGVYLLLAELAGQE